MDPVMLLKRLERYKTFWKYAWKQSMQGSTTGISVETNSLIKPIDSMPTDLCVIGDDKVHDTET